MGEGSEGERFAHRIRVRYCETDRMGVAHHGSYVDWFEEARTEFMRRRGCSYREMEDGGLLLQVVDMQIRYRSPVTYDDEIEVDVEVVERKRAALTLGYAVRRAGGGGALVATGSTRLACVDREGGLRRLPPEVG